MKKWLIFSLRKGIAIFWSLVKCDFHFLIFLSLSNSYTSFSFFGIKNQLDIKCRIFLLLVKQCSLKPNEALLYLLCSRKILKCNNLKKVVLHYAWVDKGKHSWASKYTSLGFSYYQTTPISFNFSKICILFSSY